MATYDSQEVGRILWVMVVAGDTQSTFWARLFMFTMLQRLAEDYPLHTFRTFIDDINQSHYHHNCEVVATGNSLTEAILASHLIVSNKSVCLASKQTISDEVIGYFNRRGITIKAAKHGKDLGVGTTAGRGRCAAYINSRIISIRGRVSRIKMLHRYHKKAGKLFNSGAYPQGTYGFQAYGIAPSFHS